ncbi:hypothetical protein C2E31_08535 [Rhodopirellula baltica]|nr:hypothetical protein C2E31_08535 [Rhodopirellula baltica]
MNAKQCIAIFFSIYVGLVSTPASQLLCAAERDLIASLIPAKPIATKIAPSLPPTAPTNCFVDRFRSEHDRELFARLTAQLSQAAENYQSWGVRKETALYPKVARSTYDDALNTKWNKVDAEQTTCEAMLRLGEKYRTELTSPADRRIRCCFDGTIARVRSTHGVVNGPESRVARSFENRFDYVCPHITLTSTHYTPSIDWLYSPESVQNVFAFGYQINGIEIRSAEIDGHPCDRVSWFATMERDGQILYCDLYLARDRNYIPIRMEFGTPAFVPAVENLVTNVDAFQQDEQGRWFPHQVTLVKNHGKTFQVAKSTYELTPQFDQTRLYSDSSAILDQHHSPPPATVKPYASPELLTTVQQRYFGLGNPILGIDVGQKLVVYWVALILTILLSVAWVVHRTSLDKSLRDYFMHHRFLFGVIGISMTALFGVICMLPSGWLTFGFTLMAMGLFGLAWIAMQKILFRETKISILSTLFAAAAIAIMMSGYSMGTKRMKIRQQMIDDIRNTGGQVAIGMWRLDEEGLFLPAPIVDVLGEAWSGRAHRAAIEQQSFNRKNVKRWCLDEVRWLGIASATGEPFDVDVEAISAIKNKQLLWTFHADQGYLNDDAISELTKFSGLVDLHFDCQGRPLSKRVHALHSLERIWLTNAVVDDELLRTLADVPQLESLCLINPSFVYGPCELNQCGLQAIDIMHATVDHQAMRLLGQLPTFLSFTDCKFNFQNAPSPVELTKTHSMMVLSSQIDDRSLVSMGQSPNLDWLHVGNTNITIDGIEQFSQMHPRVPVSLE